MKIIHPFLLTATLITTGFSQRPTSPWVFRGVMPNKPRILFMHLHNNLAVAYETNGCQLYMAWDGGMQNANEIYNHQTGGNHGTTLYAQGNILHLQSDMNQVSEEPPAEARDNDGYYCWTNFSECRTSNGHKTPTIPPEDVWQVMNGGANVQSSVDYAGHSINGTEDLVTLRYNILVGSNTITVRETPDYVSQGGDTGIERVFTVAGIPAGMSLSLRLTGTTINRQGGGERSEEWSATGGATVSNSGGHSYLAFSGDGQATVTGVWR